MRKHMLTMTLSLSAAAAMADEARPGSSHPVIELRQYKIVAGKRDAMIDLFERNFVESQEAVGMQLAGQFRDLDDPNRFTWIRAFPGMAARAPALQAFYFGPVWQAHRATANPMLDDNDNVLLLRPAAPYLALANLEAPRAAVDAPPPPAGLVVVTIFYLWKDPGEGFTRFFSHDLAPAYAAAGLPVRGAYVPESEPNNFPRLPVRQGEKVLVWITRVSGAAEYERATAKLRADAKWSATLLPRLADFEERAPQVLRLAPTPRSRLR
jgi:NIPSNAP